jgi:hypothetical protein
MTLADLVDLEAQLARDHDADPAALAARDRALAPASPGEERGALLSRWLERLREADPAALRPGRAVASALAALRALLLLAGLVAGWGVATALLGYRGGHPVNVWDVLLALVGSQVLLLLLLAAAAALRALSRGGDAGALASALAALHARLAALAFRGDRGAEWRQTWHRIRARRSLYRRVEPWLLLGATQSFAVAFNVAALVAAARLVVFSDVPFGWSTTLVELGPERFHAVVSAIAAPWRAAWPEAVPTAALVEATRYSRLEGAYLGAGARRAADPLLVGGWWRFVVAAIACYGLAPRVALLALARARAARLLRRLPLDDAEVARAVRRLEEPLVETRAGGVAAAPPGAADGGPERVDGAEAAPAGAGCQVLLWRDVPEVPGLAPAIARHTRRPVLAVAAAGGRDWDGAAPAADGGGPLVVVAEGFEAPDRALIRLLASLRVRAGPRRHVLVLLVDLAGGAVRAAADPQVRVWRERLARLEDPFLAVEPLEAAP